MTFVKGQSGNPAGRGTEKLWRDAVRKALSNVAADGKTRKIVLAVNAMVDAAIAGDVAAANHLADRLDGKAVQILAGDPDAPLLPGCISMIPVPPEGK